MLKVGPSQLCSGMLFPFRLACVGMLSLICLFSCNSSVPLFYSPSVLLFFSFLIARCSPVKTITQKALERRGLNNKETRESNVE